LVAYVKGAPAAYAWSQPGANHLEERLGFEITVGETEMYCYDIYVGKAFRRLGLARYIAYANLRHGHQVLGKTTTTAVIEIQNLHSRVANERIGWKRADLWIYLEAFGRSWHRRLA